MSYYKIINGIRYDRSLLDAADHYTTGRGEGKISLDEIQSIYSIATDAEKLTKTEWRTLRYISQYFTLTEPARKWLQQRFDGAAEQFDVDKIMTQIVRKEFGFKGLHWQISNEEASRQNENISNIVDFPSAVRQSLRAFLEHGYNQLSLGSVIRCRVSGPESSVETQQDIRDYMNGGGLLFLVPQQIADRETLGFDLPNFVNVEGFWYIGLHIPALSPVLFMAQGARSYTGWFYNTGYISRKPELNDLIFAVVRQVAQFKHLSWDIDPGEVERQLQIQSGQNFGDALFSALDLGIFNGDSSFSFRDFILQDIWQDPDRSLEFYMRDYLEAGVLTLLSPETGVQDFKIPAYLVPDFNYKWVFGVYMPRKTDAQFVITAQREGNLDASWNDGFMPRPLTFEQQIQMVVGDEFDLPRLQITASEAEFEAQRTQFGPDYRSMSSLVRQALNTILHDYVTPLSVFNTVAQVYIADVPPEHFADPHEYRAAIKQLIINYLRNGSLEFLPIELPHNNPPDGESIQLFWQFFGLLPALADIGFWVIIPRHPDDDQLPYCYGFN